MDGEWEANKEKWVDPCDRESFQCEVLDDVDSPVADQEVVRRRRVAGNGARFLLERRCVRTDCDWRELVDEPLRGFERDSGSGRFGHLRVVRPVFVVAGPNEDHAATWYVDRHP